MLENVKAKSFTYTRLSPEEMKRRSILGILYGPIADTTKPTRNGRLYPREAWEKAIHDPIFQEQLHNGWVVAELEHPKDRTEIDPREGCAVLASEPKIGDDGFLYGEFHILDLPNGRILKTYCDYGSRVGVSSRAEGDLVEDMDGNESVVPESLDLTNWDCVILPAVKEARMNYMKESLGTKKSLQEALKNLVDNADGKDKEIMKTTIDNIEKKLNEDINTQKSDNINVEVEQNKETEKTEQKEVGDSESNGLVKSLTETLKSKVELEKRLQELQEQLAVRDTKVNELKEELNKYKQTSVRLSSKASECKNLKEENQSLKEQLKQKDMELIGKNSNISILREKLHKYAKTRTTLKESMKSNADELTKLNESLDKYKSEISKLKEDLSKEQSKYNSKVVELETKLSKQSKLVESKTKDVRLVVDKYIESKARVLGITSNEIRNRLNEKFTLEDVDKICESLQQYNLRIGKLPFSLDKGTKVKINESKSLYEEPNLDDDVSGLEDIIGTL